MVKLLLGIGGKELVTMRDGDVWTALHSACRYGPSYKVIKMLIDVGGKDLVMAKTKYGSTALHLLCDKINDHTKTAHKIKLLLEVGDANVLLSTKLSNGKTPVQIATNRGASDEIKNLLTPQFKSNSDSTNSNSSNFSSLNIVPACIGPTKQSNQEQETTSQSCKKLLAQLKEATEQRKKIQNDYDQKCADCCNLQKTNQVESSALTTKIKELHQCKRMNADLMKKNTDLENEVEAQGVEIDVLSKHKKYAEKATYVEHEVQTQRTENTEYRDDLDKLTQICSEQKMELHQLKESLNAARTKRKHINDEEQEQDLVVVAQPQSSKRNKVGKAPNATSVVSSANRADDDEDMLAEQFEQYAKLMSRYLDTRKELQSAKERILELE